jgi:hypothetical protein
MPFLTGLLIPCDLLMLVYEEALRGGFVELGRAPAQSLPLGVFSRSGPSLSNSVRGCAENMLLSERLDECSPPL